MSTTRVIDAVKEGDRDRLRQILAEGAAVDEQDEQGWTPLNWAAGRGDAEAVALLLDHGADLTMTGRDDRTPLMIARAAGHGEVVDTLTAAEQQRGVWRDPRLDRPYCRAYHLRDLRAFDGWHDPEGGEPLTDESVVYLHQDFTVTRSMWHGEDVVHSAVTSEWRAFCEGRLDFAVPDDLL